MANNHTIHTARQALKVDWRTASRLEYLLSQHDADVSEGEKEGDICDLQFFYEDKRAETGEGFLVTRDESSTLSAAPDEFFVELGRVIAANDLPYLEIGIAHTCDKNRLDSHGGGEARIYPDGALRFAQLVYPDEPPSVMTREELESALGNAERFLVNSCEAGWHTDDDGNLELQWMDEDRIDMATTVPSANLERVKVSRIGGVGAVLLENDAGQILTIRFLYLGEPKP